MFEKWENLKIEDTYKYMELNLNPKMKKNYQDRFYEFWAKIDKFTDV